VASISNAGKKVNDKIIDIPVDIAGFLAIFSAIVDTKNNWYSRS